ncbi:MAG: hypothetical protein IJO63_04315 [Bacilli bacterium]|nr:hypothetical protein [Bacilli bacterium]
MKFAWPEADLSNIIKKFSYRGTSFHIEYFDGSVSDYYCSDPNHANEVKSLMYSQAGQRQEIMQNKDYKVGRTMLLFTELVSGLGVHFSIKSEDDLMTFLYSLLIAFNLLVLSHGAKVERELEKFKLFFEMYDHLDEVNKSSFMKAIEFENIYQKNLDIHTVDDFSFADIKVLHRKLQEKYQLQTKS